MWNKKKYAFDGVSVPFSGKARFALTRPKSFLNHLKARKAVPSVRLTHQATSLVLYLTDRCNMRCKWCLREVEESKSIQHRKMNDMTLEVFKKILLRFPHLLYLGLCGQGEPLLNPEIFDIMDYVKARIYRYFLTTNALLLDEAFLQRLCRFKGLDILFSLKGRNAAEFAQVTGLPESEFKRQIENIQRCVRAKRADRLNAYLHVNYIVSRDNFSGMGEAIRLAEETGVDSIQFDNLIPFDDFEGGTGPLYQDDPEVVAHVESLKQGSWKLKVYYPVLLKRDNFTYFCRGYDVAPGVDAEGNVTGCMRVLTPDPSYGNVFKDQDFMNGLHFLETRRMFLGGQMPVRCRTCVEMSMSS